LSVKSEVGPGRPKAPGSENSFGLKPAADPEVGPYWPFIVDEWLFLLESGEGMKWTSEEHNHLLELVQKHGTQWKYIAQLMTEKFGKRFRAEQCRARFRMYPEKEKPIEYKETHEILPDGSHQSDKLIRMNSEQAKDVEFLLKAHGFDVNEWELVSARNNIWNVYSKQDGIQTLYSSKITVKPKKEGLNLERLIEAISNVKPFKVKRTYREVDTKRLLEIPLFDQHFPISDYEYYKPTQERILDLIYSRHWEEILLVIGQDMFHNDNHRGTTSNGTQIEKVDMEKAWKDAERFFFPIIDASIERSNKTCIKYSKGNHDESLAWAFVKMLKHLYPDAEVDDSFEERKTHTFGKVFIGITHGDKGRKDLHNIFPVEFPLEWAQAKTREIHTGHYHREDGKDIFGMMVRTLATRNKTDQWHKDNGFIGNHKRFMLFQYNEEELEAIYYV